MHLDGTGPLFAQVYRALRAAIVAGRFGTDTRLPATRELATELGVSRTTILLAYEQLTAEGYVAGRQGSGTYVLGRPSAAAGPSLSLTPRPTAPRLSRFGTALSEGRRQPLESAYVARRPALRWDFRYGMRSLDDFPLETWQRCLGRTARTAARRLYDYGPPQGSHALRTALADYLTRARGVRCTAEHLLIVTGSQQAFDLAARVLLDPRDRVIVEEPGYEGARHAVAAVGATVLSHPVDDEGLVPTALPAARLAIVTPAHQFPLGGTMSWQRRSTLLAWAQRTNAWMLEDDYDGEYRFDGAPIPPLKALDDGEQVLYLGTFSKVMFPALRLGYLVLPPALVEPFTRAKLLADGGSPQLEQEALADFIARGAFARHVRRSRARADARRRLLIDALATHLGSRAVIAGANAGLHVVVWLPGVPGRLTGTIARRAAEAGIGIYPITPYFTERPRHAGYILGYAGLPPRDITTGVARLAHVVAAVERELPRSD